MDIECRRVLQTGCGSFTRTADWIRKESIEKVLVIMLLCWGKSCFYRFLQASASCVLTRRLILGLPICISTIPQDVVVRGQRTEDAHTEESG